MSGESKSEQLDPNMRPVVIIGIGQLGQTFASGFLRLGKPVFPVVRGDPLDLAAKTCPDPEVVVVAVAENELDGILECMPASWKDRLVLLQNELLPPIWLSHGINDPTVFVCWYEKKQHSALLQPAGAPSQAFGPHAQLVVDAHAAIGIKCYVLSSEQELLDALVAKAVLILVINICGLELSHIKGPYEGGTFEQLLASHRQLFDDVASEAFALQSAMCGSDLDADAFKRVLEAVLRMMESVPEHRNRGRVALDRLQRAITYAERLRVEVPTMRRIFASVPGSKSHL
eukprot:TRINITY_DN64097_c0_g1_i1.p1 TRINITY_DN64097_c0_g1~~TRINITY_DN64097_c0_g1_i1.p1  ORF type:complete len:311 (+),score=39.05 TRINITY_DN64097_c0_g1_i1:75-935(+)